MFIPLQLGFTLIAQLKQTFNHFTGYEPADMQTQATISQCRVCQFEHHIRVKN